jgi:hypothetical protein
MATMAASFRCGSGVRVIPSVMTILRVICCERQCTRGTQGELSSTDLPTYDGTHVPTT